ncbi:MAG: MFS transporter [Planctomycetota bacterium]
MEELSSTKDKSATGKKQLKVPDAAKGLFYSLRHRNYRIFFIGQIVSLIGSWTQTTAQSWLIYDLTHSKLMLGLIMGLSAMPMALFSILGGGLSDRFPRRTILIITQTLSIFPPVILAALVLLGIVEVWHIATAAVLLGIINAFDLPTRQSFIIELVGKEDLMNAIGLNSGAFNASRIIGPAVAGVIMISIGTGYCFLVNGLTFIAPVIVLVMIKIQLSVTKRNKVSTFKHIKEGFGYVKRDMRLLGLFGLVASFGTLGFSYAVLLPVFVRDIFESGELGYGGLLSFAGAGSIIGSFIIAFTARRVKRKKNTLFTGMLLLSSALTVFSLARDFVTAAIILPFIGMGLVMFMATANTLIQTTVSDDFRGRIMGIWTFVFGLSMPAGHLLSGVIAEHIGVILSIKIFGIICAFITITAMILSKFAKAPVTLQAYQLNETGNKQEPNRA